MGIRNVVYTRPPAVIILLSALSASFDARVEAGAA